MDAERLTLIFDECYSKELCYPKIRKNWSSHNKSYGMCAITALIVNDFYGGDFGKIFVDGVSHYFNIIDGKIVDLTVTQFKHPIDYADYKIIARKTILADPDTASRYNTLKERLLSCSR